VEGSLGEPTSSRQDIGATNLSRRDDVSMQSEEIETESRSKLLRTRGTAIARHVSSAADVEVQVSRRFSLFWVTAFLVALMFTTVVPEAAAQVRRGHGVRSGGAVAYRSHYYRPYYRSYYRPYYYRPYFYGFYGPSFYNSFWYPYPMIYGPYGAYGAYGDPFGAVKVEVRPRDAKVFVDGYFAGVVDDYDGAFQRLRLRPGPHEIEVYLDGYRSLRQTVYLTPGSTFKLRGDLAKLGAGEPAETAPVPKAGPPPDRDRDYESQPPPAAQPGRPEPPPPGERRGRVSADARFGSIAVRVQPDDAEVLIDGEAWLGSDQDGRLLVNVPAGSHRVDVRKRGHESFSTEVDVHAGETTPLNVSLPEGRP
jgi:hypothetical protein